MIQKQKVRDGTATEEIKIDDDIKLLLSAFALLIGTLIYSVYTSGSEPTEPESITNLALDNLGEKLCAMSFEGSHFLFFEQNDINSVNYFGCATEDEWYSYNLDTGEVIYYDR